MTEERIGKSINDICNPTVKVKKQAVIFLIREFLALGKYKDDLKKSLYYPDKMMEEIDSIYETMINAAKE